MKLKKPFGEMKQYFQRLITHYPACVNAGTKIFVDSFLSWKFLIISYWKNFFYDLFGKACWMLRIMRNFNSSFS